MNYSGNLIFQIKKQVKQNFLLKRRTPLTAVVRSKVLLPIKSTMTDQFNLPEYEKLVSCPYNKAHQVVQHRLGRHIIKCVRSHGGSGFKECTFNWTHIFPVSEIDEHEKNCPERVRLEKFKLAEPERPTQKPGFKQALNTTNGQVLEEENWDDLPPVPTYDPRKACKSMDVVIDIKHGTPSQRKARKVKEHQRLTEIRGQPGPSK